MRAIIPAFRGLLVIAVLLGFFGMHVLPGHDAGISLASASSGDAVMTAPAHGDDHPPADTEDDHQQVCVARPAAAGVVIPAAPMIAAKVPLAESVRFTSNRVAGRAVDAGRAPPCLHKLSILRI